MRRDLILVNAGIRKPDKKDLLLVARGPGHRLRLAERTGRECTTVRDADGQRSRNG